MTTLKYIAALLFATMLAACGGGTDQEELTPLQAMQSIQTRSSIPSRAQLPPLTDQAEQLLNFAEGALPTFFVGHQTTATFGPLRFRFYPGSGIYLGVVVDGGTQFTQGNVYVMGGIFGGAPVSVGPLTSYITPTQVGGGGNLTLDISVSVMGSTFSYSFPNIPAPNVQDTFCTGLANDTIFTQIATVPGYSGSMTINTCSFSANTGHIAATMTVTQPFAFSIPFDITYTWH